MAHINLLVTMMTTHLIFAIGITLTQPRVVSASLEVARRPVIKFPKCTVHFLSAHRFATSLAGNSSYLLYKILQKKINERNVN